MSEGSVSQLPVSGIAALVDAGAAFIDVREPLETSAGRAPGVTLMPMQSFKLDEVPADVPLVIICRSGARSDSVAGALAGLGYTTYNVIGGMIAWDAAGLPVVAEDGTPGSVF